MKINIRNSVFETNSSSVHTLSIKKEKVSFDDIPKTKTILLEAGEFGWDVEKFNSFDNKLSYIYTYIIKRFYEYDKESLLEIKEDLNYLFSVIKEVCPDIVIEEEDTDYEDVNAYIDHEDELSEPWEKFKKDKELLKNLLFCSESIIFTSNDNDGDNYFEEEIQEMGKEFFIYIKGN